MGTTARSSSIIRGSSRVHGRRTCRQRALLSVSSPADSLPRRSPRPLGVPWHVQPPSRARVSSRLRAILWTWTLALAQLCFFFLASLAGLAQNSRTWRSRFVAGSSLRFRHRLASFHCSGERALRKERAAVFGEAHLLASASEGVARSTIGGWRTRGGSKGRFRRSRRRLRIARVGTTDT